MNTASVALINVIKNGDRTRDTKIVGLRSPNGSLLPVSLKRLVCKGAAASTALFDRVARIISYVVRECYGSFHGSVFYSYLYFPSFYVAK